MTLRRAAAAAMLGARRGGAGLLPGTPLLLFADSLYGRRDEAAYMDSDETVDWFAENVQRSGTWGVLSEPISKNWLDRSVYLDATWTTQNAAVRTSGSTAAGTAPDGTTPTRIDFGPLATSQLTQTIGNGVIPDNTVVSLEAWIAGVVGGETFRLRLDNKAGTIGTSGLGTLLEGTCHATAGVWTRYQLPNINVGGGGAGVVVKLLNSAGGGSKSVFVWGYYAHAGRWARSPIRTSATTPSSTQPDTITYLDSLVPDHLRKRPTKIGLRPHWAPTGAQGLIAGEIKVLAGFQPPQGEFGGIYEFRIRHTGTDVRSEIVRGGLVVATSPAIAGSSTRALLDPMYDPLGGRCAIGGVWGAVGTPGAMPVGQVRLGGRWLDTQSGYEADGYLSQPEAA